MREGLDTNCESGRAAYRIRLGDYDWRCEVSQDTVSNCNFKLSRRRHVLVLGKYGGQNYCICADISPPGLSCVDRYIHHIQLNLVQVKVRAGGGHTQPVVVCQGVNSRTAERVTI